MKKNSFVYALLMIFTMHTAFAQTDPLKLSSDFIEKILKKEDYSKELNQIENLNLENLKEALDSDKKKMVFWINIYNGFILHRLENEPSLYDDRNEFFKSDLISIAGENLKFSFVEHGILRRSANEYALGFFKKFCVSKLEKDLRVDKVDFRLHFALNCGANDCPPVRVYTLENLSATLDENTKNHLNKTSTLKAENKTIEVTSLMSWFRGDFGGKSGAKKILRDYGIIESQHMNWSLSFANYDWTLNLDNYKL